MQAHQLLHRYAQGERDFSGADLRGCNLKGKDLSGANFTGADIRGTNFTGANLTGACFCRAKAGVQNRWKLGEILLSFVLSTTLNGVSAILNTFFIVIFLSFFFKPSSAGEVGYIPDTIAVAVLAIACC